MPPDRQHIRLLRETGLIGLLFILCVSAGNANSIDQARWRFEVLLDDKKIGYHDFIVSSDDGVQKVQSEAKFNVKLLFVNVFSYRHRNEETWQGNCLSSIDAETESNGKDFSVGGGSTDTGFQLKTEPLENQLPPCIMTFAYWNPDFLMAEQLLNSQTGEYEKVAIGREGEEVLTIDGQDISATKYSVSVAAGPITLWYAAEDQRWLALESVVTGGRILRYQPLSLPEARMPTYAIASKQNSGG